MSRKRGSCPGCDCDRPCLISGDDFNRPNSTNIGDVLVEQYGDSEIKSNRLWMPGGLTPAARVYTAREHPVRSTSGIVWVTLPNLVMGNRVRALINLNKDTDESHWAELFVDDPNSTISISTGQSINVGSALDWMDPVLKVCFTGGDNGVLSAWRDNLPMVWGCAEEKTGGYRAGLSNPGAPDAEFDDFIWEEHYVTNSDCKFCMCSCLWNCIKGDLLLTFTASDSCAALDGETLTLEYMGDRPVAPGIPGPWWHADGTTNPACWDFTYWEIQCDRPTIGAEVWYLEPLTGSGCIPPGELGFPDRYSCDPFFLAWDITVPAGAPPKVCGCCGEEAGWYTITITEMP